MRNMRQPRGRLPTALVAMALVLVPLSAVTAAAPAFAAPPEWVDCARSGIFPSSIAGQTHNQTRVRLTRTFLEKGVSNAWQPEPAEVIEPKNIDRWCVNAVFGSALKVEYTTPDGTKVLFIADQFTFASPSARCEVSGPSAAILECRTQIQKHRFDDSRAVFTLIGAGNAGGPLPTVSCAFVYDKGNPDGVIRGDLCSGVPIGFDGPARVVETSGDRKSFLCADVKLTQEKDQHGSFVVIKATRCNAQ